MGKCAKWYPQATDQLAWIHDFNLVWGMVPGAHDVCNQMLQEQELESAANWDRPKAANELRHVWDERNLQNGMRDATKGRASRTAFHTEPTFDDETPDSNKRTRTGTHGNQKGNRKQQKRICWACEQPGHEAPRCFLVLDDKKKLERVEDEVKQRFDEQMKEKEFRQRVEKLRKALKTILEVNSE